MRLLFVEFPEHVEEALCLADGCKIIALTPHAAVGLDAVGAKYSYPEDIFPWRDVETAGIDFLANLQRAVARMDEVLSSCLPPLPQAAFTPARFGTYELLLITGPVWTKLYRVSRIFKALSPSHVTYFATPSAAFGDTHDFRGGSLYAEVIASLCASLGIAARRVERPMPDPCQWAVRGSEPAPPSRAPILAERAARHLSMFCTRISRRRERPRVLAIQEPLPLHILSRYVDVSTWRDSSVEVRGPSDAGTLSDADLEAAWAAVGRDTAIRSFFLLDGNDWFSLVAERLRRFVLDLVPKAFRAFGLAEAVIARRPPHALLYSNIHSIDLHAIAHAARRRDIPVVCEPHGPYGHFVNHVFPLFDAISATDYLIGGPAVRRYNEEYGPYRMREHCTGAAMMDRARSGIIERTAGLRALHLDPDKPVVIFAIQNVSWNLEYGPYALRDDRRTWEIERRILDTLGRCDDLQIVLKGHPASSYPETPLRSYGEKKLGPRFRFVSQWQFGEMLDMADFFVLGYAVTTIFQALTRDKRVYAINDFYQVVPFHRRLLEDAVYYAEDVDAFCAMLERDVDSGDAFRRTGKDRRTFLRELAEPDGGDNPTIRMARAVRDIATACRGG